MAEFKTDEVVEAVRTMAPLKGSGKDGFPTFLSKILVRGRGQC